MENKCKFGCGNLGIKQFKDGTWCCSKNSAMCPKIRKKVSKSSIGKKITEETKIKMKTTIAIYNKNHPERFQKHSLCMKNLWKNNEYREKYRKTQKEGWTEEARYNQSKIIKKTWENKILKEIHRESQAAAWKNPFSKLGSEEYRTNIGKVMKKKWEEIEFRKLQIVRLHKIKENNPFFYSMEELKEDEITGEVLVRCKVCREWFKPTYNQLYGRIYALEHINGNKQQFFYCSEECKIEYKEKELSEREKYRRRVLMETNRSIRLYGHKIKDLNLRSIDYHLDHKYSIFEGYKNNVDVRVIGHWLNLEIIPKNKNLIKSSRCSVEIQHLLEGISI